MRHAYRLLRIEPSSKFKVSSSSAACTSSNVSSERNPLLSNGRARLFLNKEAFLVCFVTDGSSVRTPHLRSRALACNVPSSFKEFLTSEPLDRLTSLSSWISGPFATSACTGSLPATFSNSSSWSTLPEILEISSAKSNSPSTYIVAACLAIASMMIRQ